MQYTQQNGGDMVSTSIKEGERFTKDGEVYEIVAWSERHWAGYYRVVGGDPQHYYYATERDILDRRGWERVRARP
jgi:hypothetical protein